MKIEIGNLGRNIVSVRDLISVQLKRLEKTNLTLLEIGAFNLDFSIYFNTQFPYAQIHAIEPCPLNFSSMKKKLGTNNKIALHNLALSDIDGIIDLYTLHEGTDFSSQSNSVYRAFVADKDQNVFCEHVKSLTLDSFCTAEKIDCIDLLKLNCEGSEYKIFLGKAQSFLNKTNIIEVLLHGKNPVFLTKNAVDKKREINALLVRKGFRLLYGYNLEHLKRMPLEHIRQIWIRNNYI